MESLVGQIRAFAATIVTGAAASFCYDYYRVVRGVFRLKKIGTCLGDLLFWMVTTAVVFLMLLWGNWGELRLYVFIGLGLGALIYFRLFSGPVSRLVGIKFFVIFKTWELLVKTVLALWAAFLFPFRLVLLVVSYPVEFLRLLFKPAGSRIRRWIAGIKSKLSPLAFWTGRKKE